jgi:hypothetical protein
MAVPLSSVPNVVVLRVTVLVYVTERKLHSDNKEKKINENRESDKPNCSRPRHHLRPQKELSSGCQGRTMSEIKMVFNPTLARQESCLCDHKDKS